MLRALTKSLDFRLGEWIELNLESGPRRRTRVLGPKQFSSLAGRRDRQGLTGGKVNEVRSPEPTEQARDEQQGSQDQVAKLGPG